MRSDMTPTARAVADLAAKLADGGRLMRGRLYHRQGAVNTVTISDRNRLARLHLASRLAEQLPGSVAVSFQKQALPPTTGLSSFANQLGRDHSGIVEDQTIARLQKLSKITNVKVINEITFAIHHH